MIRALYTAASGLISNLRQQELVANNIANLSTPGYKGEVSATGSFASVLVTSIGNAPVPVPLTFRRNIGIVGTGAYLQQRSTYLDEGELRLTDLPLDLALRGPGFFVLQGPRGVLYTRNGNFARNDAGLLVSTDGFPVLGADGQPIALQNAEGGAVEINAVVFKRNGEVFAGDDLVGVLRFVEIPAGSLVRASETSFAVARAVEPVTSGGATVLVQGALEESNIDIGRAATQLFEVSQRFQANQRVFLTIDETLERAVREIGRVG
jgi:flagellar basal-body rod protein FlgG